MNDENKYRSPKMQGIIEKKDPWYITFGTYIVCIFIISILIFLLIYLKGQSFHVW